MALHKTAGALCSTFAFIPALRRRRLPPTIGRVVWRPVQTLTLRGRGIDRCTRIVPARHTTVRAKPSGSGRAATRPEPANHLHYQEADI